MPLWEISFRSRFDYPFIDLSRQFPDTPISMWCLWDKELLQVSTRDPRALEGIEKGIRAAGHVVEEWVDAGQGRIFLLNCTCDKYRTSIWNIVDAHECLEAPPAVYRDGWGYFRVLSLDDGRTRALFQDLNRRGPTELIRKRELPLSSLPTNIWVHGLFSELTPKQRDAMLQAHRYGYYSSPRQIKAENIAKGLGLSRSTYEEHLRKAENR
ncbi:MAG: helix-turn-helix domain-containing protein, partial [Thermoplasmata archaeon]|nr:helix-turn-helix domain-containing protein [Thermoplasmata archaeon]